MTGDDVFDSIFADLYKARPEELAIFGPYWCGPDTIPREPVCVARYPARDDGDGLPVEVWSAALPARFYQLRVSGYKFSTGSGSEMAEWAHRTALLFSDGMLGLGVTS